MQDTHTPPHGAACQESWKKGTHTGREGTFRQELSIEQDRVQHKAQFKFVPQNFFFFSFSGSLEYKHTTQTAERERERETDYRQRCYEVQTKEMANHGKRKGTRMGKKNEQDERERRLISTLRSPSLTAPAQSFKVCHHL